MNRASVSGSKISSSLIYMLELQKEKREKMKEDVGCGHQTDLGGRQAPSPPCVGKTREVS